MTTADYGEGSKTLRLLLVLSSMSPLFLLWAIRGTTLIPQGQFILGCLALFCLFNSALFYIIYKAQDPGNARTIEVGEIEDVRQDVISYLFAMLLPFYTADLDSGRNLTATAAAFLLVVLLFWGLGLHYLNLWIVIFQYHCLRVTSPNQEMSGSRGPSFMVITRSSSLRSGESIKAHRISSSVLVEEEKKE